MKTAVTIDAVPVVSGILIFDATMEHFCIVPRIQFAWDGEVHLEYEK